MFTISMYSCWWQKSALGKKEKKSIKINSELICIVSDQSGEYGSRGYRGWEPETNPWPHMDCHFTFSDTGS